MLKHYSIGRDVKDLGRGSTIRGKSVFSIFCNNSLKEDDLVFREAEMILTMV